ASAHIVRRRAPFPHLRFGRRDACVAAPCPARDAPSRAAALIGRAHREDPVGPPSPARVCPAFVRQSGGAPQGASNVTAARRATFANSRTQSVASAAERA